VKERAERHPAPNRNWLILGAVGAALALAIVVWFLYVGRREVIPERAFERPDLGVRFTYPSRLVAGPNFVRARSGAVLTIERHSLFDAEKEFVAALPDSLFPQVQIQLDQVFRELTEVTRRHIQLAGRPALQVELTGKSGNQRASTLILVDIVATDEWVYVLRNTIPGNEVERDRADFEAARRTFALVDGGAAAAP
jgi:hypothetical protein